MLEFFFCFFLTNIYITVCSSSMNPNSNILMLRDHRDTSGRRTDRVSEQYSV